MTTMRSPMRPAMQPTIRSPFEFEPGDAGSAPPDYTNHLLVGGAPILVGGFPIIVNA